MSVTVEFCNCPHVSFIGVYFSSFTVLERQMMMHDVPISLEVHNPFSMTSYVPEVRKNFPETWIFESSLSRFLFIFHCEVLSNLVKYYKVVEYCIVQSSPNSHFFIFNYFQRYPQTMKAS